MCNSELRGIERSLDKLYEAGIRPVAISVDASEVSRDHAQKAGYTFPLLSDQNVEVIRRYDVLHPGAGADGKDIARPAEFLLDSESVVRWMNLTDDIRVRARPDEILKAAKALR